MRTGSVIGRNFDLTLLRALSPDIGEGKFLEGMDEAIGIRIIESVPDTPGGYRFSHALIQQAVYEEIPPMRRAQVHGVIGETLENLRLEDHAENAAELAHHFAEAKDVLGTEKITRYSLLAGEQALATYAYGDSVAHFERGLSTRNISLTGTETAPDEETAALLFGLARAYSANSVDYQLSQSFTFLSRAFEYYAEVGDIDRAVAAAELPIAPPTSRIPGIGLLLTRALALVPPDSHEAGRLLSRYGGVLGLANGDYEGSRRALGQAISIAKSQGDVALEAQTLAYVADVSGVNLRWHESVVHGLRAVELNTGNDNNYSAVLSRWWTVVSMLHLGDIEPARPHASFLRVQTERHSTSRTLAWLSCVPIAFLACVEGDWESGREYTDHGLSSSPKSQQLIGIRALLEYETGEFDTGAIYLERLIDSLREIPDGNFSKGRTSMALATISRIVGADGLSDIAEEAAKALLSTESVFPCARAVCQSRLGAVGGTKG